MSQCSGRAFLLLQLLLSTLLLRVVAGVETATLDVAVAALVVFVLEQVFR